MQSSSGQSGSGGYSEVSGSELDEEITWIEWFCRLKGNEYFVEIEDEYIQDDFNLTGLGSLVPYYERALNLILDVDERDESDPDSGSGAKASDEQEPLVETAAQMLYGLIHQRYIMTSKGLAAMLEKYQDRVFGACPNAYCDLQMQAVVPCGASDTLRQGTAKVFCPRCSEMYYPRSRKLDALDGAYFGTSFPHLFFLTYNYLVPVAPPRLYVPRIFGFKVNKNVKAGIQQSRDSAERRKVERVAQEKLAPGT